MILCIDIGNTQTKFGLFNLHNNQSKNIISIATKNLNKTFIQQNFQQYQNNIKKITISSVVPHINNDITQIIKQIFHIETIFASKNHLNIDTNSNESLGADRIANIIGTLNSYPLLENMLIFDFGTATTACLINRTKYIGGLIFPGINTQLLSLQQNTQIPKNLIEQSNNFNEENILQNGTTKQIATGINYMHYITIKSLCTEVKKQLPQTKIIGTGGNSRLFINLLDHIEPQLTLIGLYFIALQN